MTAPGGVLSLEALAAGTLCVLVAFVVRGFTGFGAALIAIPLLTVVFDIKTVVLIVSVLSVINGLGMAWAVRHDCDRSEVGPLFGGFLIGMGVGVVALVYLPGPVLKRAFGGFVALFALRLLLAPAQSTGKRWPRRAGWIAGVFSGITGGMFGASGPPAVIYLYRRLESARVLRATVIVFFLAGDLARFATYLATGVLSMPVVCASLCLVPASFIGTWAGTRLQTRASPALFRRCVAGVLALTGALFALGR